MRYRHRRIQSLRFRLPKIFPPRDEESFTNKNAHALATRVSVSQYENWDEDISEKNKRTKKDFSEMSEREREEEIFRRMQEKESQETRLEISRSLKRQRGTEKNDDIEDWDETAPIKNQESKRLKVSDVFGEIDEYATSPRLDEQSDSEIDNIKQLDSIRLSRYRLEKYSLKLKHTRWMHMPFFNDRIVGFFVRVSIGTNNNNPVYRIAQIVGVIEQDKPYTVEKQLINKRLILRYTPLKLFSICKQEKSFRMSYVSNQSFTQHEFERWVTEYRKHGEGLPRISEITEKVEDYFFCCNYVLTESDINKMVLEKQKYSHVHQNYSILKKTLINELELSKLDNNQEKIDELEIKLAEVNKVCTQLNDNHEKKMEKSMIFTEEKRLQVLNEREKLVQEEILADRNKDEDPFTRRRTLPTLIQFVNSVTLKSDVKEKILESRKNLYKTAEKEQKIDIIQQTVEKIALQPSQPDLRKLHDFELDINIDV
ncbi:hypothetical protein HZS_5431 [Henneguya salminicola]|nr:hypothetical protein HZS_5431 [Henneguya salminicola]